MNKTEIVTGILENLALAAENCHRCHADSLEEMGNAARGIDRVISDLSGTDHVPAPGGEGGVPEARFFLLQAKVKAESFQFYDPPSRTLDLLENVLVSTSDFVRGLQL
jgi:hypothetical protein